MIRDLHHLNTSSHTVMMNQQWATVVVEMGQIKIATNIW